MHSRNKKSGDRLIGSNARLCFNALAPRRAVSIAHRRLQSRSARVPVAFSGSTSPPPAPEHFVVDSPLEGTGFEPRVPQEAFGVVLHSRRIQRCQRIKLEVR
jgi:hypothetical protein